MRPQTISYLTQTLSLDIEHLSKRLSELQTEDSKRIVDFIQCCVNICSDPNLMPDSGISHNYFDHPRIRKLTQEYAGFEDTFKTDDAKAVFDVIHHAFSHFMVGGLQQLYEHQQNEVWYPKIILTQELTPNDIDSLPEILKVYRGCNFSEFKSKNFKQAWTTNMDIASDFAFRHYARYEWFNLSERCICSAEILRTDILYSKQSGEFEVVVQPDKLINIKVEVDSNSYKSA